MQTVNTLLNESAAAELLDVAPQTLRGWRREGFGPPFVRLGRQRGVRYRQSDLEKYIQARLVTPRVPV